MPDTPCDQDLVREIVAHMNSDAPTRGALYVDVAARRIVALGVQPTGTSLSTRQIAAEPHRFRRIPERALIESREHLESFLVEYAGADPQAYAEAEDALDLVTTPAQWRAMLGGTHPVVTAFDEYLQSFCTTIAHLLASAPGDRRVVMPRKRDAMPALRCSA